jgi:ribosomal-protein-alanine N-acetyltransferase
LHAIKHILTGHKILPMTEEDLGDVLAIERVSFPHPWSWGQFKREMESPVSFSYTERVIVGEKRGYGGERLGAYIIFWIVHGEAHILNMAVAPGLRRMGLAKRLLTFSTEMMRARGVVEVFLEVRVSNRAAIRLYEDFGFEHAYVRERYYGDEDAIVMRLVLN